MANRSIDWDFIVTSMALGMIFVMILLALKYVIPFRDNIYCYKGYEYIGKGAELIKTDKACENDEQI